MYVARSVAFMGAPIFPVRFVAFSKYEYQKCWTRQVNFIAFYKTPNKM
jgi:hypothetical protein